MSGAVLLEARGVGKRFGGFTALQGVDIALRPGERLGLIGPNGSGKSTFVNCISGDFAAHDGSVTLGGQKLNGLKPHRRARLGLARTFQLPQPFNSLSVLENVRVPLLFAGEAAHATARAMECLEQVELAAKADKLPRELTQVEQRRLELARAIALRPQLLIADEAMAGLSHAEVDQILDLLRRLNAAGTAVIMIEHIMRAVTEFSERLIVFVAGRKIADGLPREVLALPEVEGAYLGKQ
ncbi:ABC transporter ATP-binding protein [Paracraurococcus lichenis]|uniref:ABC transporter ATP-binding protein n=1 Tax=Paracraurococcus lichenis TaxID=3064888 RepID=A0ABT9E478_9PROT|nr:ABC transporter ATP-binding protein [Paracraurococcus sp. LOR1-02]MDO9710939.1 ABC transporter ATP-binding protein [Paracraurococcus sp. LOR1-02]